MFQFPGCPSHELFDSFMDDRITPAGFPHSDIHGSKLICSSPWLFAAYHVFRRRPVPWHPPCALYNLIVILRPILQNRNWFFFTRCFPSGCAVFKVRPGLSLETIQVRRTNSFSTNLFDWIFLVSLCSRRVSTWNESGLPSRFSP